MDEALEVRYEEGREERDNEILDLISKGYTSADIENHLRKTRRPATDSVSGKLPRPQGEAGAGEW